MAVGELGRTEKWHAPASHALQWYQIREVPIATDSTEEDSKTSCNHFQNGFYLGQLDIAIGRDKHRIDHALNLTPSYEIILIDHLVIHLTASLPSPD